MEVFIMKKLDNDKKYKASIYLRLSKEDRDKVESNSIKNQRDLVYDFLQDKTDIEVVSERVDDGYSGATFDRPSVQKMIEDTKNGVINCIIVKDLSRFGRNFIEVGRYIDQLFPSLNVRMISINENFDSAKGRTANDNIILPFLNLVNDAFCRDISIKIRSQLEIKRKKGDFIGSFAVYGYLKDPKDKHKLMIDPYAREVIRDIFKWKIEGQSQQGIANRLNEFGILSPMEYKRFCGMDYHSGFQLNSKAKWSAVAIGRILKNEFYIGTLVQGKRTTPNHKVKTTIYKPSEEWVRVENTHEAIIDLKDFTIVKELLTLDTRIAPNRKTVYTFSGILYCADCGQGLIRNSCSKNGKSYYSYLCGTNRTKKGCTSHRITEKDIYSCVLFALQQHISTILRIDNILQYMETLPYEQKEMQKYDAQIVKLEEEAKRYTELKTSLYESMREGILDKSEFLEMKGVYEMKRVEAENTILYLKEETERLVENLSRETLWIEKFKTYKNIDGLDRKLVVNLIDKIIVSEDKRIEIIFRYQYNYNRVLSFINTMNTTQALPNSEQIREVM